MIAETSGGRISGRVDGGAALFAGVPYAAEPTGQRRFQPPDLHPGWAGDRPASDFAAAPPQRPAPLDADQLPLVCSEDCLYVNVWTPAVDDRRRAVVVWFHDGAFMHGAAHLPQLNGARLATNGDVVVVTVGYRLGIFGWLELGDRDGASSGNLGLLDQIAALEWTRDNIESFGGDPDAITIAGNSAGAMSAATLLVTPTARGLFKRAALSSGALANSITPAGADEYTAMVLEDLGRPDRARLLDMPVDDLLLAQERSIGHWARSRGPLEMPMLALGPVSDGDLVHADPIAALAAGAASDVDIIIGSNLCEASPLRPTRETPTRDLLEAMLESLTHDPSRAVSWYLDRAGGALEQAYDAIETDRYYRIPALQLLGAREEHEARSFTYRFDWASQGFGNFHSLEVPFIFGTTRSDGPLRSLIAPTPDNLEAEMLGAWTAFARTGDPGSARLDWPTYGSERSSRLFGGSEEASADVDSELAEIWVT